VGLLLGLALAGCADPDDGTDGIASAGGTPTPSTSAGPANEGETRENMLKYAQCMRENGIPEFPDPEFQDGGGIGLSLPQGTDKAKVDAAQAKCKQYLPNGGEPPKADPERLAKAQKFAQCMRDSGFPDFPDPRPDGGIAIDGNKLDPDDPKLQAAQDKCHAAHMPGGPGGSSTRKRSDT
jgi:hypothetical protein